MKLPEENVGGDVSVPFGLFPWSADEIAFLWVQDSTTASIASNTSISAADSSSCHRSYGSARLLIIFMSLWENQYSRTKFWINFYKIFTYSLAFVGKGNSSAAEEKSKLQKSHDCKSSKSLCNFSSIFFLFIYKIVWCSEADKPPVIANWKIGVRDHSLVWMKSDAFKTDVTLC